MADPKPCPWCGEVPDVSNPYAFRYTNGSKWGALQCCGTGPEVRTGYGPVEEWRDDAIEAWNRRTREPEREPDREVRLALALLLRPHDELAQLAEDPRFRRMGFPEDGAQILHDGARDPRYWETKADFLRMAIDHYVRTGTPITVQPEEESDGE